MINKLWACEVEMSPMADIKAPMIVTTLAPNRSQSFPAKGPKKNVKDMQRDPIHAENNQMEDNNIDTQNVP